MNFEETIVYSEEMRKLAVQLGIPIFTAIQQKREQVIETVSFQESYDFLNKITWHIELIPSNPEGTKNENI